MSEWTTEERTCLTDILSLEHKREITILMRRTASDTLLLPQLLYAGKTEQCHPKGINFPYGWDILHSESHWRTKDTNGMLRKFWRPSSKCSLLLCENKWELLFLMSSRLNKKNNS